MADILNYQAFAEYIKNKKDVNAIIKSILTTYQAFTILNDDVKLDIVTVADFKNKLSQNGVNLDIETSNTEVHDISNNMMARLMSDVIIVLATQEHQKGKRYPLGDDNFLCLNVEYKGIKPVYEFDIHEHEDNGTRAELQPVVHFNKIIKSIIANEIKHTDLLSSYSNFIKHLNYQTQSSFYVIISNGKSKLETIKNILAEDKHLSKDMSSEEIEKICIEYMNSILVTYNTLYNDCNSEYLKKSFIAALKHSKAKLQPYLSELSDLDSPSKYEWYSLYMKRTNRKKEKPINTTDTLLEILNNYIEVLEEILL